MLFGQAAVSAPFGSDTSQLNVRGAIGAASSAEGLLANERSGHLAGMSLSCEPKKREYQDMWKMKIALDELLKTNEVISDKISYLDEFMKTNNLTQFSDKLLKMQEID